jgi:hypothetical protein
MPKRRHHEYNDEPVVKTAEELKLETEEPKPGEEPHADSLESMKTELQGFEGRKVTGEDLKRKMRLERGVKRLQEKGY